MHLSHATHPHPHRRQLCEYALTPHAQHAIAPCHDRFACHRLTVCRPIAHNGELVDDGRELRSEPRTVFEYGAQVCAERWFTAKCVRQLTEGERKRVGEQSRGVVEFDATRHVGCRVHRVTQHTIGLYFYGLGVTHEYRRQVGAAIPSTFAKLAFGCGDEASRREVNGVPCARAEVIVAQRGFERADTGRSW